MPLIRSGFLSQSLNLSGNAVSMSTKFAQTGCAWSYDPFSEAFRVAEFAQLRKDGQQVCIFGAGVPCLCLGSLDQAVGLLLVALVGGEPVRVEVQVEHEPFLLQHQELLVIEQNLHCHKVARWRASILYSAAFTSSRVFLERGNAFLEQAFQVLLIEDLKQICCRDFSLKLPGGGLAVRNFSEGNLWKA